MVDVSRRLFLGGALALASATVIAPSVAEASSIPRIVGDGVHDDSTGLTALFNGQPVQIEGECVRANNGHIELSGGIFFLGSPIVMLGADRVSITGGYFHNNETFPEGRGMIEFNSACAPTKFIGMTFVNRRENSWAFSARD